MKLHLALLAALATAAPVTAQDAPAAAVLKDLKGSDAGTAKFSSTTSGVLLELDLQGLPPNAWVAVHIHQTGDCDPTTGYESAGPHFNPAEVEHGYVSATGPHAGDMPNQRADEEGAIRAQIFAPLIMLTGGEPDIRGKAIVVHAKPDDYHSQPAGNAGDRLLCGIIE